MLGGKSMLIKETSGGALTLLTVKYYLKEIRWSWSWHISKAAHQDSIIPSANAHRNSGLCQALCQVQYAGAKVVSFTARLLHSGDTYRLMEETDISKHTYKTETSAKKEKSPGRECNRNGLSWVDGTLVIWHMCEQRWHNYGFVQKCQRVAAGEDQGWPWLR